MIQTRRKPQNFCQDTIFLIQIVKNHIVVCYISFQIGTNQSIRTTKESNMKPNPTFKKPQ